MEGFDACPEVYYGTSEDPKMKLLVGRSQDVEGSFEIPFRELQSVNDSADEVEDSSSEPGPDFELNVVASC